MALTAPPQPDSRDAGAVRAAAGAITVTTVSVLPVFLTGALAVQLGTELGFDPAGLGLVVALYFGVSALCSLKALGLDRRSFLRLRPAEASEDPA